MGKRTSRKLEDELEECGCGLSPARFREILEQHKLETSPDWTVDDLVCRPDDARKYCDLIRAETDCPKLSDYVILKALMNIRRSH